MALYKATYAIEIAGIELHEVAFTADTAEEAVTKFGAEEFTTNLTSARNYTKYDLVRDSIKWLSE